MKNIVILGGLGSGLIAASIIKITSGMELLGFLNDRYPIGVVLGKFTKYPVIGKSKDVHKFLKNKDTYVLMAYKTMKREKEMWESYINLNLPKDRLINVIHPTAVVPSGFCSIGNGILMAANSQISADAIISDSCMLFGNAFVGHDTFVDEYVSIGNNASIGAEVYIGKAVHIGSNSTIRQNVKIGNFSLVGMGSLVLNDVPENCIVAGVPAKVIKVKK